MTKAISIQPNPKLAELIAVLRSGDGRGISLFESTPQLVALAKILSNKIALDHIGIAVHSIEAVSSVYNLSGIDSTHIETIEHEQVRAVMLPLGETRIELIEPGAGDSTVTRFLAKRGEGLHHIALRVPQIEVAFQKLKDSETRLVNEHLQIGAGGHTYFFVHPSSTGGVLIEIVGHATSETLNEPLID